MDKRAVVLLSGGIDSTTCLADAVQTYGADKVLALSMYYGQKHQKEIESAQAVAKYYGVDHIIQEISGAFDLSDCTLLQGRAEVAHESYAQQLKDMGGEGTEALLDTLLVPDIRIHFFVHPQVGAVESRDMQPRLSHQGKQSHRFQGHGLAAGVGPGNNQQVVCLSQRNVNGNHLVLRNQRVASFLDMNIILVKQRLASLHFFR